MAKQLSSLSIGISVQCMAMLPTDKQAADGVALLQGHSVFNVLEATLDKLPSGRTGPKAGAHAIFFSDDLHMAGCSGSGVPGAALRQALDQQVPPLVVWSL